MPGSTISLDSLSSPSPSPSPSPENLRANQETNPATLDSDSELSELTEEEQETEPRNEREDIDDDVENVRTRKKRPARRGGAGQGRRRRGLVPAPMWGWATKKKEGKSSNAVEEEEEEDAADPPKAMEEEEEEEEEVEEEDDETTLPTVARSRQDDDILEDEDEAPARRRKQSTRPQHPNGADNHYQSSEDEELDDESKSQQEDDEEEDLSDAPVDQPDDLGESENEVETESEEEDIKEADAAGNEAVSATTSSTMTSKQLKSSITSAQPPDPDGTVKSPRVPAPLAAVVAASSIMAGSTVIEPPSPSSSTGSRSAASSRSPSPTPAEKPASKRDPKQKPNSSTKQNEGRSIIGKKQPIQTGDDLPEQEGSVDDIEVDEPSPEQDLDVELESDLQPAHRAEALDVLAQIELRFALLRERVYVEKMEALAWEEALVIEEKHPEQVHMQAELEKRRNKRLELASKKRSFEVTNVAKRRRLDEDATWSWWRLARDELQVEMIAEANRKRRKLERERRGVERSPPVRRIPARPLEIPTAPSLRQIVKSSSLSSKQTRFDRHSHATSSTTSYPELGALNNSEIASDLDFLYQNRRFAFETHRLHSMNAGIGLPMGYDGYGALMDGGGPSRMPPLPTPSFHPQHQLPPPSVVSQPIPSFPPPYNGTTSTRSHHQLQATPIHSLPPQFQDQDMERPQLSSSNQHHGYFGSSQPGPYPSQNHAGVGLRRSMSPPLLTNGVGGAKAHMPNGSWPGPGPSKHSEWDPRREMNFEEEERERERARERELRREKEKARERSERDREREHMEMERERHHAQLVMQQQQSQQQLLQRSQHHRHPPSQQSLHSHPPQSAHHHHHHHHHHVVHHHHSSQQMSTHGSSSAPPTMNSSPRAQREFESGRPQSSHPSDSVSIPAQAKLLPPPHWKKDDLHPPPPEFRDHRDRSRPRPTSATDERDRERPLALPFVLSPPHSGPASVPALPPPPNGPSMPGHSRRGSWSHGDDGPYRHPAANPPYMTGSDSHREGPSSPNAHRYSSHHSRPPPVVREHSRQNSAGQSPPRSRVLPPLSPSSAPVPYTAPNRSPARYGPPVQPQSLQQQQQQQRPSPASSPALNVKLGAMFPPRLGGPGGHNPPSVNEGKNGFRPNSPPPPPPRLPYPPINVSNRLGDKPSPRLMPAPPPTKMNVPQMVDGH